MAPAKAWPIPPCVLRMPVYLTRRLVDIAQDIIINEHDCGTHLGIWIRRKDDVAGQSMMSRLYGRLVAERVLDPQTGEVLAERDDALDHELPKRSLPPVWRKSKSVLL